MVLDFQLYWDFGFICPPTSKSKLNKSKIPVQLKIQNHNGGGGWIYLRGSFVFSIVLGFWIYFSILGFWIYLRGDFGFSTVLGFCIYLIWGGIEHFARKLINFTSNFEHFAQNCKYFTQNCKYFTKNTRNLIRFAQKLNHCLNFLSIYLEKVELFDL